MTTSKPVCPPVDPEIAPALRLLSEGVPPSITPEMIGAVREYTAAQPVTDEALRRNGTIEFEERTVPGPAGAPDIGLLICRPAGVVGTVAGIYHTHGGGMFTGDNRTLLSPLLEWAVEFKAVVVSVEYRLAPEHPDPAPIEDCYAGLVWTAEHADELGIDPARLLIAGTSAGGGLAAGTALLARDRGGPELIGQILMCPMLDDRMRTPSSRMLHGEATWDFTSNQTGWTALLGDRRGDRTCPATPPRPRHGPDRTAASVPRCRHGGHLPGRGCRLRHAYLAGRGTAELNVWPGGFHGFTAVAPAAALSQAAESARTDWVRRQLGEGK